MKGWGKGTNEVKEHFVLWGDGGAKWVVHNSKREKCEKCPMLTLKLFCKGFLHNFCFWEALGARNQVFQ
jgi:hypothetical protein